MEVHHHNSRGETEAWESIPPPSPPRCGMRKLNANLHAARPKAAEQHRQTRTLFSGIAMGAFR